MVYVLTPATDRIGQELTFKNYPLRSKLWKKSEGVTTQYMASFEGA